MRRVGALLLSMLSLVAPERAAAEQALCVYQNQSYSDGAHICIQRQLMSACTADGERAVWKLVEDRQLASLCTTPIAADRSGHWQAPELRRAPQRRHAWAPPARPGAAETRSSRCFVFMGRRFCE